MCISYFPFVSLLTKLIVKWSGIYSTNVRVLISANTYELVIEQLSRI